ncbi:hypothetical protein P168DRAFT_314070 [Aspergillus campestris IBT 28561]|uniref:SnoaL-like domain-containing protein n=1 Tax=Aspergillus campestris (strain IBT 28561) TaxID=1392248 RepID=A0A2I1DDI1_ASPC2|nr:uncharacterized protein P168DRAFT_314070 [Aspergillus campestris IBT 28561]PKY07939.1 hypothetical protein P168DRAFT_314070 [Aspergillus campestris IBT 28561]
MPPTSPPPRASLIKPVRTLCTAFASASSPETLAASFTQTPAPLAHEHGLPELAPFLGRDFTGTEGIKRYFTLVASELSFEGMEFDDERDWVVDGVSMAVALRGRARFVCRASGEGWDETFCYRVGLGFEQEGTGEDTEGELKVREYRVWADTGAAYLARLGRLRGETSSGDGGDEYGKKKKGGGHDKVD